MPVEAVWQVKLKLLPSSTVPEALLVMVGVWGTTAQKHKHRLFHMEALQPRTYTFRAHERRQATFRQLLLAIRQRAMLPSHFKCSRQSNCLLSIPNAAKQMQPKQITSIHFLFPFARTHARTHSSHFSQLVITISQRAMLRSHFKC